jgi:general secretion pathway protein F
MKTGALPLDTHMAAPSAHSRVVRLRVRRADGSERVQEFQAPDQGTAIRQAAARGLKVLAVELADAASNKPAAPAGRGMRFSLILFSQELLALLDAGLNLTEALSTLLAKERQPGPKAVLADLLLGIEQGRNFSDVLAMQPALFPDVFVATVRASERTGDVSAALGRHTAYQMQFEAIRKKLVTVAIYPAMLLAIGLLVTLFLLGYVVPRFSAVYESAGRDMPWMSAALLTVGQQIHQHWLGVLAAAALVLSAAVWAALQPAMRSKALDMLIRLPWLTGKADEFRLARFYRALSLLLSSGIALPKAMSMVVGLLSGAQQARLARARQAVDEGRSFSVALVDNELASPVAESLIKVGERSGQLGDMLERTAKFHDDDFARWIDWASRLLEPVLMLIIGAVIGTVVVLMYMPIFELAGSLQ